MPVNHNVHLMALLREKGSKVQETKQGGIGGSSIKGSRRARNVKGRILNTKGKKAKKANKDTEKMRRGRKKGLRGEKRSKLQKITQGRGSAVQRVMG